MPTKPEFTIEPELIYHLWQTTANYKTFAKSIADVMCSSTKASVSKQWANALSVLIEELSPGGSLSLWGYEGKTPTPEKVVEYLRELVDFHMTTAADNELEACCEWLEAQLCMPENAREYVTTKLRAARHPQPTLKSQALKDFETVRKHSDLLPEILDNIENALKSIPE